MDNLRGSIMISVRTLQVLIQDYGNEISFTGGRNNMDLSIHLRHRALK